MAGRELVYLYAQVNRPIIERAPDGTRTPRIVRWGFPFTTSKLASTFLTLPNDSPFRVPPEGLQTTNVAGHNRGLWRESSGGAAIAGTTAVRSHERVIAGSYGRPGSKTVQVITGRDSGAGKNRLSFRFPGFVTVPEISDILATLIPAARISATPDATQIKNVFRLVGGRTYPIMARSRAEASNEAAPGLPSLPPSPPTPAP